VGTCNWEDAEEVLADLVIWSSLKKTGRKRARNEA